MKNAVIIPDSFKGTLASEKVCNIIAERIRFHFPKCKISAVPVSDGGEGFCGCMIKACGGKIIECETMNPYGEKITAEIGLTDSGNTAIIEMAAAAGLGLAKSRLNPELTSTFGVGLMIKAARELGCKKVLLGLGGSCTNDGGCGAAAALGVKFLNSAGKPFIPTGGTLKDIDRIIPAESGIEIEAMCDVKNVLYGKNGAAYVFAPQKGADDEMVLRLDDGLKHLAEKIREHLGIDISGYEGGGAAGGFGAGVCAFMGGSLKRGIDSVLDAVKFEQFIKEADFIFTGEGKIDSQSRDGKVIDGIISRAEGIPVIAFAGGIDGDISQLYSQGLTAAFTINMLPEDLSVSAGKSEANLSAAADNVLRLIKHGVYGKK